MMKISSLLFVVFCLICLVCPFPLVSSRRTRPSKYAAPEYRGSLADFKFTSFYDAQQVHISLTGVLGDGQMVVGWVTYNATEDSLVQWGNQTGVYSSSSFGSSMTFVDPNPAHLRRYIHNAMMTQLVPGQRYFYRVGSLTMNKFSPEFSFYFPTQGNEVLTMAVFGDMGVVNSQSMQYLAKEVANRNVDIVLQVGDFAYNLDDWEGYVGDLWFNQMQAIAALAPFHGTPGNHENSYNFSHYTYRFSNWNYIGYSFNQSESHTKLPIPPGFSSSVATHPTKAQGESLLIQNSPSATGQNWWNSWDYMSGGARIHMISIDTEIYYDLKLITQRRQMYQWILDDLKRARQNGADWLILFGHRPMYCSNVDDMPDCSSDAEELRIGLVAGNGLEDVVVAAGVDIYFTAHEHSYERTFPVYQGKWQQYGDDETNSTYIDPSYPTHIITGSAGCHELLEYYDSVNHGGWSTVRSSTYGYGKFTVYNNTHAFWEQFLDEGNQGTDQLWIIKTENGQKHKQEFMKKIQQTKFKNW